MDDTGSQLGRARSPQAQPRKAPRLAPVGVLPMSIQIQIQKPCRHVILLWRMPEEEQTRRSRAIPRSAKKLCTRSRSEVGVAFHCSVMSGRKKAPRKCQLERGSGALRLGARIKRANPSTRSARNCPSKQKKRPAPTACLPSTRNHSLDIAFIGLATQGSASSPSLPVKVGSPNVDRKISALERAFQLARSGRRSRRLTT